ncbi:MAG TPA: tetratricopeptide repeat protein [Candidatus Acidoferrum sp.]|nr:tetratricopeptide repeat protein [Candidatus Acidoferrum sp.]
MRTQRKFISRFSPNRTDPEDLERINVQRQDLLARSVSVLRESALTQNKHHLLFVGPRGSGKTHLLALIFYRLWQEQKEEQELDERLRIAWLNEDETSTSFLDLLLRIYRALSDRYPAEFPAGDMEQLSGRDPVEALDLLGKALLSRIGRRTVLVLVENLDTLFRQLDESDQRAWRAFIQNHPVFATAATAQSLFAGVSEREQPFFGFFDTNHLQTLTAEEAMELLQRIAQLNQDGALTEFLGTPRGKARVQAIHHLLRGNHRLYIVLSDFMTRESLDELVGPFEQMVDEQFTPYYQERLRWLSPQQRKIVEFLCLRAGPVPVKEIAAALFSEPGSVGSQLQKLREMGYVRPNPRGRESLYELAEPLMRLSMEVKNTGSHQPLQVIVDFLRIWFDPDELEQLSARYDSAGLGFRYLTAALEKLQPGRPDLRRELLLQGIENLDIKQHDEDQLERLRLLAEASNNSDDWMKYALACYYYQRFQGAIEWFGRVVEAHGATVEQVAWALVNRGASFGAQGRSEEAIADFTRVIELRDAPIEPVAMALANRGIGLGLLGRTEEAIADYTRAINLSGAPVKQVATALFNRGVGFGVRGRTEEAIADFTRIIELRDAPIEPVAMALANRGIGLGLLGRTEEAIADYTRAIDFPSAPAEAVASALINRGAILGRLGRLQEGIADFTRIVDLPKAPPGYVAQALYNRGAAFGRVGQTQEAIADYARVIALPGAPAEGASAARGGMASALLATGEWNTALEHLTQFLAGREKPPPVIAQVSEVLIQAIFRQIGSSDVWQKRAAQVVALYREYNALVYLGGALVQHLTVLKESPLNPVGLDQWLAVWEGRASDDDAMQFPLRLLRAGIAYLKTQPRDEGVLLQLPSEERSLVRLALGLAEEPSE